MTFFQNVKMWSVCSIPYVCFFGGVGIYAGWWSGDRTVVALAVDFVAGILLPFIIAAEALIWLFLHGRVFG